MRWTVGVILAATMLGGCLDFSGTYDTAAARECRREPNPDARRACLDAAATSAYERRQDKLSAQAAHP